jgi:putative membrane protein
MTKKFSGAEFETGLRATISELEQKSSAELVVAVRARSRTWFHIPVLVGVVAAWATLAYMLYSNSEFGLAWFLIIPFVVGGFICTLTLWIARWSGAAARSSTRRQAVREAARATFVERGVHRTSGRTGVLLFVAVAERMAEVVADDGVLTSVDTTAWDAATRAVDVAVRMGPAAMFGAVSLLADVVAAAVPHTANDVNELPDELIRVARRVPRS